MKRFILLLAAAVLLAAMCVPAGAFTDSGRIGLPYASAVEAMTEQGILNGFPDGSFQPAGTLTREQGAKIVTYIVLGDMVDALRCSEAPFDDVEADRWSAPCISWCVQREILLGYGDGRFGPDDLLTGDQFAKMLLCALDLARSGNYVGLGGAWFSAVREDGDAAGLYDGDEDMRTDRAISREQAALMAYNAIRAAETAPHTPQPQPEEPQNPETPQNPQDPQDPQGTQAQPEDTAVPANPGSENPAPADPIPAQEPSDPADPTPGKPGSSDIETPELGTDDDGNAAPSNPAPADPFDEDDDPYIEDSGGDIVLPEIP